MIDHQNLTPLEDLETVESAVLTTGLDGNEWQEAYYHDVQEVLSQFGQDPSRLLQELNQLPNPPTSMATNYPALLLEIVPFVAEWAYVNPDADNSWIDSGFPLLNQNTLDLEAGLYLMGAEPREDLTAFCWQVAQQVAELNSLPVLYFSFEQSRENFFLRALSRLGQMDAGDIAREGVWLSEPRIRYALKRVVQFSRYITVVAIDAAITPETIKKIALSKMAELQADRCLIVIDDLQHIPSGRVARGLSLRDREVLRATELREIAGELGAPVLAISALHRTHDQGAEVGLAAFGESGGIENVADVAIVMTPSHPFLADDQGPTRHVDLRIVKSRFGPKVLRYLYTPQHSEFREVWAL